MVVQDFAYGKYLGNLSITFDTNGDISNWHGNPILLDHTVSKDSEIVADVVKMKGPVDAVAKVRNIVVVVVFTARILELS